MAAARSDRQVTIADVAERAGVSQMTVSRVINASAAVRSDKRARVERAIRTSATSRTGSPEASAPASWG